MPVILVDVSYLQAVFLISVASPLCLAGGSSIVSVTQLFNTSLGDKVFIDIFVLSINLVKTCLPAFGIFAKL